MSGIKGWEKAVLIKRPDNFCASTLTQKAFIPSYEKSYCKPDMTLMVSMEYRRMWFEERAAWQVDAYPKVKKNSSSSTYEQRWRDKLKDKLKKKESGADSKPKRKKLKKYQSCKSKTDSGRGFVGCLPKGDFPCQAKATPGKNSSENSPALGSLTNQGEANSDATGSPKSQSPVQRNLMSQGDNNLTDQSAEVPVQHSQGHELVPKCPRCRTFHAQRTRCPTTVLCKDNAFKDRIMSDTC